MNTKMVIGTVFLVASFGAGITEPATTTSKPATNPATTTAVAPRAARSVHLGYPTTAPAMAFYNEVTVRQSVPGSYFMCAGFSHGYFGIQQPTSPTGKKVVLFSVWDPTTGNAANAVPVDQRVEILYQGRDVTAKRFGGEGTGGQSFFNFDWKVDQTYRFLLTAKIEDKKTSYAAYLFLPETKAWKHLATMRTTTNGDALKGLYSFIEDFRRDTKSATEARRAEFGNAWMQDAKGQWQPLTKARFTASGATWEAKDTIDMGVTGSLFYLQTGGATVTTTKLSATLDRPAGDGKPPEMPPPDPETRPSETR